MEIIDRVLSELEVGPATTFGGMTVYALFGRENGAEPRYLTLDRALGAGEIRIGEVGDGGHVSELRIENRGKRPVLLLDGEELVGAKQNRVLNVTVLCPAGETLVIPVSCVEAGRWAWSGSRDLAAAQYLMYSAGRAAKAEQVACSVSSGRGFSSDQSAVWDGIARKMRSLRTPSATSAMRDVFERRSQDIDEYVGAFPAQGCQCGGIFAIGGRPSGVELFDHEATLRALLPKLVRSYALDAIETVAISGREDAAQEVPCSGAVAGFLLEIRQAKTEVRPGVGLGQDVRLTSSRIVGGGLVHEDRVVHLSAFRKQKGTSGAGPNGDGITRNEDGPSARMSPMSRRRGGRG